MIGNINRRGFLGTAVAGVGAVAIGMGGTANAIGGDEPWDKKVYPSRDPAQNYANIVAALTNPRNKAITLMSTTAPGPNSMRMAFNMTGQPTIEITRDVTIIGRDAKIICGQNPVFSCSRSIHLTIRNIYFKNTFNIPIQVSDANGLPGINVDQIAIGGDEPWD